MIKRKEKKCKGIGKAKGHGCGNIILLYRYGLCYNCFKNWFYLNNKKTNKYTNSIKNKKPEKIKDKKYYQKKLQEEINTIVRLIDSGKGCISCNHGWGNNWTREKHAGHRMSVGSTPELRYNLHNIFLQCSTCNIDKNSNIHQYNDGIKQIYGLRYYEYISSLRMLYPSLNLTREELKEYIIRARKVKTRLFTGENISRTEINEIIGIYL